MADDDKSLAPDGKLLDAADKDEIDPLQFARKGQELQDLMSSVRSLFYDHPCRHYRDGDGFVLISLKLFSAPWIA